MILFAADMVICFKNQENQHKQYQKQKVSEREWVWKLTYRNQIKAMKEVIPFMKATTQKNIPADIKLTKLCRFYVKKLFKVPARVYERKKTSVKR